MKIHLVGNAHLDPAWMWRWEEGFAAFAATCRSALDRIAETDGFIFTTSSAACFEFIEQTDPPLFEKIREAVASKRWSLAGGWWVEPDCNLPSGESFIRQGLYGQSYFRSRFGIYCDTGYCIDSFGHNANLPMLLKVCGMKNYVFMRPEQHEQKLPASLFGWRAASGDEVAAYRIPLHYSNYALGIREKLIKLPEYQLFDPRIPWMIFYGVGNHGGGPTKEQLAQILELQKENKEIVFSSPSDYFAEIEKSEIQLPVFEGELYPHAVGAYSAHSLVKKLNRTAETGLLRAEILSTICEQTTGMQPDWQALEKAWKPLLLAQFHDTLGGVSTSVVMADVATSLYGTIAVAARGERIAEQRIAAQIDTSGHIESLVVFNPNSFAIESPVEFELWHPAASERGEPLTSVSLIDEDGSIIPTQLVESSGKIAGDRVACVAVADLPAFGWKTFGIERQRETASVSELHVSESLLSNGRCSLVFDRNDSRAGSLVYSPAAVYRDQSDTWGFGVTGFRDLEGEFKVISREVIESGPVRARLRVTSRYNSSTLTENFILQNDSPVIEQRVRLDWHEQRKVCKLRYAHGLKDPSVRCAIPYGSIARNADGNEVPCSGWVFVEGSGEGLGVVSPFKSSYSSDGNYLALTIARSALFAHHAPPHVLSDTEEMRYLDQGEQEFINYIVLGSEDWRAARMPHLLQQYSNPPSTLLQEAHRGSLSQSFCYASISEAVIATVLKRPYEHQNSESIISRIYEPYGRSLKIKIRSGSLHLDSETQISGFQVKTLLLRSAAMAETDGIERI